MPNPTARESAIPQAMSPTVAGDDFVSRIGELFANAERHRLEGIREMERAMTERVAVEEQFASIAAALHRDVIRPRLEALAGRFEGARLDHFVTPVGVQSRCMFARSDRYPASVTLTVGVMLHANESAARLFQSVELVPILFECDKAAALTLPLEAIDVRQAAAWLEERLLSFVRTYLRLETDPNYQRANEATDPVCGMRVSAASTRYRHQYEHHTYAFCSAACEGKFAADPEFYLKNQRPAGGG